jgi:phage FluMu gp28-like protein
MGFIHLARCPWVQTEFTDQLDWLRTVDSMEQWLDSNIGPQHQFWSWAESRSQLDLTVAFCREEDLTFFVLQWH